ncbi:AAA family ATPase [Micromonospora sp. DT47]|uniref:AAA family ATPase n=1 Tax=Micromonospora sp. DT47 TaxID=3393431 RepID=UPI003CEC19E5
MSPRAVGRLRGPDGSWLGTAFAVAHDRLITCWHCLAARSDLDRLRYPDVDVVLSSDVSLLAHYLDHDPRLDVALLAVDPATPIPAGWSIVGLDTGLSPARFTTVDVIGWPTDNPSLLDPQVISAEIRVSSTTIGTGQPVMRLYSPEVAARLRPHGFSGGPVLAAFPGSHPAIGVLRWMQSERNDPGIAVGGAIYAVPAGEVLRRWPELGSEPAADAVARLTGDPGAPGWSVVANFLDSHLYGLAGPLPFAGRDAELAALQEWLSEPQAPQYHLISGGAGAGKSTLLARWVAALAEQPVSGLHVIFVPISGRYEATSAQDVFRSLLHRVARLHGVPYDRMASAAACRDHLNALLAASAPDGSTLLVVIDALDEAGDWEPGPQHLPRRLGERVRVVLSARHTRQRPTARHWMDLLDLDIGRCTSTVLGPLRPEATAVLIDQVRGTADGNAELAARLHRLTDGEPVTTALYLRDLAEQPAALPARWPEESGTVRVGIAGYLARWLTEQRRQWDRRDAKRIKSALRLLNLLALAEGPLPRAQLRPLLARVGSDVDAERLHHALNLLDRFLLSGPERDSVVLAHPLIAEARREWLRENDEYESYAGAYVEWAERVLDEVVGGRLLPSIVPTYLVRHASAHLLPTSAVDGVATALPMASAYRLVHPKWRQVQDQNDDGVDGYRRDASRVLAYARAVNAAAVDAGRAPPYLPEQICGAASLAGEQSALQGGISPRLVGELVRYGLWRPSRALAYVAGLVSDGGRAEGVVALAAHLDYRELSALRQILESLKAAYSEDLAWASGAWARRLLDLGLPDEAVEAAGWLPQDHRCRDMVRVWVLAELIPALPAPMARQALAAALELINPHGQGLVYAASHLTRRVPRQLAEELWHRGETRTGDMPTQRLIHALQGEITRRAPFLDEWHGGGMLHSRSLVAAAPWLHDDLLDYVLAWVFADREASRRWGDLSGRAVYDLGPGLHYSGLMSIVPARLAPLAADWVREKLDGSERAVCLLQLLPVLATEDRDRAAAEAFADPRVLSDLDLNCVETVAPALAEAGFADRLLEAMADRRFTDSERWLKVLGPGLSRGQTEHALAMSDRGNKVTSGPGYSPAALARLAAFDRDAAARALDLVYESADERLPSQLRSLLPALLTDFTPSSHDEPDRYPGPGTTNYGAPWWEDGIYRGVPWQRYSNLRAYRRRPADRGSLWALIAAMLADDDQREPIEQLLMQSPALRAEVTGERPADDHGATDEPGLSPRDTARLTRTVVALAFEAAGGLDPGDLPALRALAATQSDPWAALTLLAAGTHIPQPQAHADIVAEIADGLRSLRDASAGRAREMELEGLPRECPWLMRMDGDWLPFFMRMLSPCAWPSLKPLLFEDGYLDGVLRRHSWYIEPDGHERLDDWAHNVLAYTPVLDTDELHRISAIGRQVRSATTRGWFYAGVITGFAMRGEMTKAYEAMQYIDGEQYIGAREAALTEVGALTPAALLPNWLDYVHSRLNDPADRGALWGRVLQNRWPELSAAQCWNVLDRWLAGPLRSRADVLADVLAYANAVHRLAGSGEVRRILALSRL